MYYADSLITGRNVAKDEKMAMHWYRKAAEQAWPDAARMLAVFYFTGNFVEADMIESSKWLQVSMILSGKNDSATELVRRTSWHNYSEAEEQEGAEKAHAFIESHDEAFERVKDFTLGVLGFCRPYDRAARYGRRPCSIPAFKTQQVEGTDRDDGTNSGIADGDLQGGRS